jgi:cellulose synthase/poly-beta-1,6-N-acetylglucosamine synthase-like glycosyltransferase
MTTLLLLVGLLLLAATLPGTLYLALLTLAGALPARAPGGRALPGRLVVVVPAHDEAAGIGATLASLQAALQADGDADLVVVADNCSDATADLARAAGARVLERQDPERRGKGYALDFAFRRLLPEAPLAFLVVDADSRVEPDLLAQLRRAFGAGARALQTRYTVLNGDESPRTGLAEIALAAFNVLRPRGRDRLGLSAGILGNGFALRREVLERVPYTASSVVEDLEYHLRLVAADLPVRFLDGATVRGQMPSGQQGREGQRVRWEGGRVRMLLEHGGRLARGVLGGRLRLLEPLAELLLPPLAYQVLGLLLSLALLLAAGSAGGVALALGSLLLVALHVLVAVWVAGLPGSRLLLLLRIPGYLLWKLKMLRPILAAAGRGAAWVRTDRKGR